MSILQHLWHRMYYTKEVKWHGRTFAADRIRFIYSGSKTLLIHRRRGGLVVKRRTPEREIGGSILTQVAVLYP